MPRKKPTYKKHLSENKTGKVEKIGDVKPGVVDSGYISSKVAKSRPNVENRVIMLAKEITKGMSRTRAIEYAMEHFEVAESQAKKYYNAAMRYLLPEDVEEYRKNLFQANMDRLEGIIDKCMEQGQYKLATEAINALNKMLGLNNGLQIGIATDKQNDTQQIVIKFDS